MSIFQPRRAVLVGLLVVATVYAAANMSVVTLSPTRVASSAIASLSSQSLRTTAAMASRSPASVLAAMSAPTGPLTVDPTVPRPDTTPCVVELFNGVAITGFDSFSYAPPADCPPPWSKVVFEMDMTSVIRTGSYGNVRISLSHPDDGDFLIFMGAPQIHAGLASWRVERDLTDYASLLSGPDFLGLLEHTGTTAALRRRGRRDRQRAPRVLSAERHAARAARAGRGVHGRPRIHDAAQHRARLCRGACTGSRQPRRERSPLVHVHARRPARAVPGAQQSLHHRRRLGRDAQQFVDGCNGGSYREVEVLVDGVLVGTAPIFPWLPSNLHRRFEDTLDLPVPSAHAINFIPYRVDVTPIASRLDDGTPHTLTVRAAGDTQPFGTNFQLDGKLFAYLDPGKTIVTGAVTMNTVSPAMPTVTSAFSPDADRLLGEVDTRVVRDTHLHGYVDTSAGRIYSTVHQHTRFRNTQEVFVDGVTYPDHRGYAQHVELHSRVGQTSRRTLGAATLGLDQVVVRYPLKLGFGATGSHGRQRRRGVLRRHRCQPPPPSTNCATRRRTSGAVPCTYASKLRDHFTGRRLHDESRRHRRAVAQHAHLLVRRFAGRLLPHQAQHECRRADPGRHRRRLPRWREQRAVVRAARRLAGQHGLGALRRVNVRARPARARRPARSTLSQRRRVCGLHRPDGFLDDVRNVVRPRQHGSVARQQRHGMRPDLAGERALRIRIEHAIGFRDDVPRRP
jgi:hypothetical protein